MIHLEDISVTFSQKGQEVHAVKQVNLNVDAGDVYGIVGYSGAGKSTLVRVINLLQVPTKGKVIVDGKDITKLSPSDLREERKSIGMIFQHFNLMNSLTIAENVLFPIKYAKLSKEEKANKVAKLLKLVGLADKADSYPSQLSGGQKQRVAIARALANDPKILLCDEATSALDPKTTLQILALLKKLNQELGLTIVLITHEMQVVKEICNKVAVMENGHIIESGHCVDIFSKPKEELTQDFIRTATHLDQALDTILNSPMIELNPDKEWLTELSYVGNSTDQPLITEIHKRFGVETNILFGNIDIIQNVPIGSLLVTMSGPIDKRQEAYAYLKERNVEVRHIKKINDKNTLGGAAHA
ncbi:ATP-binding cassette domain-containing protein [Atopobacter sp. AH10]|uniref:methionine ABC transporter ATP-binding protein n=1 Tax=Atopobacter sp. AH10 TaxID=2315861 RepID=UPI000EF1E360|nr:ATP-binding cassette domain-containing protein [Atopobacter sp. AH10]RLK62634.1 ATP-binding cassette domain-containing protein [Atopobacter sp. AH10]